ncbi:MAG: glucose 1-dehydrogenase [Anaerolineae bacterium]|nr:glucose 1-dehydrogenase [Anaerolineae bacterium]
MRLEGKVALITGAGSGIGKATAELFAAEGAKVVASDISAPRLADLKKEVEAAGGTIITLVGDVSKREDDEKMVEAAIATYGTIDIVVNNAGIMDDFVPLADLEDSLWERVMGVNLNGPMYIIRKALQTMLEKGSGSIVNVASVGGLFGGRSGVSYTASKHAVIGLTRSVAYHYAKKGIRCNAVCPGGVATNIEIKQPNPLGYERLQTTFPTVTRQADAKELANAILFLASDEASFVNGDIMVVDGGWTSA